MKNCTPRESEELFSEAFRLSPDCMLITRMSDCTVVLANETLCRLWGRALEEIIGRPDREFSTWRSDDEQRCFMLELDKHGTCLNYETILRMADGRLLDFNISSSMTAFNEQSCVLSVMRDITEVKRAGKASARLVALVESSDDAIIGKDLNGIVTSWNPGAEKIFGFSAAEMVGQSIMRIIPSDRHDEETTIIGHILRGENIRHFETVRTRKDGGTIDISVTVSAIRDSAGVIVGASKVARDITERKAAEAALRVAKARLNSTLSAGLIGTWTWDILNDCLVADGFTARMFMVDAEAAAKGLPASAYLQAVHEEDRLAVANALQSAIQTCGKYDIEYRVPQKEGPFRWLQARGRVESDSAGHAAYFHGAVLDITGRKRADESLRLLGSAVEQAKESVLITDAQIDLPGPHIIFVNPSFTAMTGYTAEEALGKSPRILQGPLTDKTVLSRLRRNLERGEAFEGEAINYRKNGTTFDLEWQVAPLCNASGKITNFVAIQRDITERKRAEARVRRLVESNMQGVMFWNKNGEVTGANKAFLDIVGYTREDLESGRISWSAMTPPEFAALDQRSLAELAATGISKPFEKEYIRKNGSRVPILVGAAAFQDTPDQGVCFIVDITERVQAGNEIRRLNAELERRVIERTAQFEAANKELESFSYSVSHDLRAPLRAVDGFSRAVLSDFGPLLPEEGQEYLRDIRQGAQRMGRLIDDLLAFSRLSRAPLKKDNVDAERMVRGVVEDLSAQREGREIDIRIAALPPCLGDPALLKQVWINLLSNAIKYTSKVTAAVIEIGCSEAAGEHVYFVRDNGSGFDMRYAAKLFGVFQRLHRAEDYEGTGVGLAIVHRIITRHGGRIWADAKVDQGAAFYFTLEGGHPA